ncbi:hypothetical protein [Vibrio echinoideorum]|uniref:hypothetical protein n=1 Tax=Vibrio echinoideorum TaxID=2100116 RepID=UPI00354D2100
MIPKSDMKSIFERLASFYERRVCPSVFEQHRFENDAKALPYIEQQQVMGMLATLKGDSEAVISHFQNALSSSLATVHVYYNYLSSLAWIGLHKKRHLVVEQMLEDYPQSEAARAYALEVACISLDLERFTEHLLVFHDSPELLKMYPISKGPGLNIMFTVKEFVSSGLASASVFKRIGDHVLSVAEKHRLSLSDTDIVYYPEAEKVSITYAVFDTGMVDVFELNWELSEEIIESNTPIDDVIVQFILTEHNATYLGAELI